MVVGVGRARSAVWAIAAGVLGMLVAPSPCRATPSIELAWSAPAACPDREEVLRAIHELAGETEEPGGQPEFAIRGEVRAYDGGFLLNLSWRSAAHDAERTMTATTCDELARAAALIVALAVNPSRAEPNGETPESKRSTGSDAPAPASEPGAPGGAPRAQATPATKRVLAPRVLAPAERLAVESSDAERTWATTAPSRRLRVRAEMAVDAGTLPHPGAGLGIGVAVPMGSMAWQAEAFAFGPQTKSIASGGGGKFWMGALALRPCLPLGDRLRLLPCAVAELELLYARGQGVDFRQAGGAWFPRFGAGAEFTYGLTKRLGVVAGVWLLAGPFRPNFIVEESEQVHRPALFCGRFSVGLDLRL